MRRLGRSSRISPWDSTVSIASLSGAVAAATTVSLQQGGQNLAAMAVRNFVLGYAVPIRINDLKYGLE